ncbi:MAG: excinuclease ABC subunit UvrC [Clostridiales bacterium]|nr:excinuclease ABC subunit UvrC [Clostridiales bacterium]
MPVLKEHLDDLPDSSGVYIMKDVTGKVIYVGKAVVLKNRVRQYFNNSPKQVKVQAMVDNIDSFEYIITLSEKDALSLESNLVKKYNPRYNILLKDDKASPYIKIDMREEFPTIEVTRRLKRDGAKYFGPYLNGLRVWDIVGIIRSAYGMRTCPKKMTAKRECLNYHIGLCHAPCRGRIDKDEYAKIVRRVTDFLTGKDNKAEEVIKAKMAAAAMNEDFEHAIMYRDQLQMLELLKSRTVADLDRVMDIDSFALASSGIYGAASVNVVRGGKMMGVYNYVLGDAAVTDSEALVSFALQYYGGNHDIPDEVCFANEFDSSGLQEYLSALKGKKVEVTFPKKGAKKKLLLMAEKNALDYLDKSAEKQRRNQNMTVGAAERLRDILKLKSARRIECYDISHISGTDKVASGVAFIDGAPSKSDYRRYKIRTVEGNNDFACMAEVIKRRFGHGDLPDLIIIDGGKGQLSAALEVMNGEGIDIPMIGLAKREEEVYLPYKSDPIVLSKSDYALRLLQRVRDEAHRFAITYHRNLRSKRLTSELDNVKGVGPKKREILLRAYPNFADLRSATVSELEAINGIDARTAQAIHEYFKEKQ